MIPRFAPTVWGSHLSCRLAGVLLILAGPALTAACNSVPLLAPSGSTITLTASSNAIPANGTVQLIAYVLEQSGTPPHPGTQVIFTTTLGVVEPAEATTDINGRAVATFRGNGQNGTATINAVSGAASTAAGGGGTTTGGTTTPTNNGSGPARIFVGTGAVGRITLSANPSIISATGGVATVTANVVDLNGNALAGVPVSFATSAGALGLALVNTDASGNSQTTLTTTVEATVTATVGAAATGGGTTTPGAGTGSTSGQTSATTTVRVNPLPTVSITAPNATFAAGTPITFTVAAQTATSSTAQIREVVVNFGDGTVVNLGAVTGSSITLQHRYDDEGTFTVTARVTDTLGSVVTAATVIVVQPQPPLSVTVTYNKATSGATTLVTFQATVSPSTTTVVQFLWNFGDNTPNQATTSNQVVHPYTVAGSYQVNVQVTTSTGGQSVGQTVVVVP